MSLSKKGYPNGPLIRAIWDCCDELYERLGRVPARQELLREMNQWEPERAGRSTYGRQRIEWKLHHGFNSTDKAEGYLHVIPDEYLEPQLRRVVYAVSLLGKVSIPQVIEWLDSSNAPLKLNEIRSQFQALTVNDNQRARYRASRTSMLTDQGHYMDKLYRSGKGRATRYVLYDPHKHGVWDIADDGKTPIEIIKGISLERLRGERELSDSPPESKLEDMRVRVLREIVDREGQPIFRKRLLDAYAGACAITECTITELLEAAHIIPYSGAHHCKAMHGILLRADIHTLFDKGLLWIGEDFTVYLVPELLNSEYGHMHGKVLRLPEERTAHPLKEHLASHRKVFGR
ncbi:MULTISPECIES: HNH endonuclease [unclassified Brenneria]|uniref:HNH endonuclease n=1 Tax=unclassified Brenneria TaxID=2634434 RepID=UPI001556CACC|nr:HNH endonuclease [Brenneria sp. hezel4-2-4]MEE3649251.1 HNH endonuclease [Brenneria sp. HEZEL_4_2_4]NPC99204.1 HNH endonuclease [Brenneria sp. hezel4-2-4]